MKMEMHGVEPYLLLFGLPITITAIVLVSIHFGTQRVEVFVPPPPSIVNQVETPQIHPQLRVEAVLPQGAVTINNQVDLPKHELPAISAAANQTKPSIPGGDQRTSEPKPTQAPVTIAQIPGKSKPEEAAPEVMPPDVDDAPESGELLPPPRQ